MPTVGITRILVKVSPKISSHRAGWIARVYSSVRSCRSFCSSTTHIAPTRAATTRQPARARGGVSSRREVSAEPGSGAAGAADIAEPLLPVLVRVVEIAAREVAEDVLEAGTAALDGRQVVLEPAGRAHAAKAAAVHERDAVAVLVGLVQVVGRDQDGHAGGGPYRADVLPHLRAGDGVQHDGRLVVHQQPRRVDT